MMTTATTKLKGLGQAMKKAMAKAITPQACNTKYAPIQSERSRKYASCSGLRLGWVSVVMTSRWAKMHILYPSMHTNSHRRDLLMQAPTEAPNFSGTGC